MKILSPVLKERTSDDPWWRTPITDEKNPAAGEPLYPDMAELYNGRRETGNVVQLRPNSSRLISPQGSTLNRGNN